MIKQSVVIIEAYYFYQLLGAAEWIPTFLKVTCKAVSNGGRAAWEVATVRADRLVVSRHHELIQ